MSTSIPYWHPHGHDQPGRTYCSICGERLKAKPRAVVKITVVNHMGGHAWSEDGLLTEQIKVRDPFQTDTYPQGGTDNFGACRPLNTVRTMLAAMASTKDVPILDRVSFNGWLITSNGERVWDPRTYGEEHAEPAPPTIPWHRSYGTSTDH